METVSRKAAKKARAIFGFLDSKIRKKFENSQNLRSLVECRLSAMPFLFYDVPLLSS